MKKLVTLFLILSNVCFASFYKCYPGMKVGDCINKLIELGQTYDIKSYKLVPAEFRKDLISGYGKISSYNLIVELEEKQYANRRF